MKKEIKNKDWREGLQKEGAARWIKLANGAVVVVTLAVSFLTFAELMIAMILSAVLWVLSVVLITVFPVYFSPALGTERRRLGCKTKTVDLSFPLVLAPFAFYFNFTKNFDVDEKGYLWLFAVLATASFVLLVYTFCRDFRDYFKSIIATLACSVLLFYGAMGYINHYAKPGKHYEECTVVELTSIGSRMVSHLCFVKFKDGDLKRISIGADDYYKTYVGDTAYVYRGRGALGIKYYHLKLSE